MDRSDARANRVGDDFSADWVCGLPRWGKKKHQSLADFATAYGADAIRHQFGGRIPYEVFVGLWFNTSRASVRNARGILIALSAVLSKQGLSEEWYSSFSEDAATGNARYQAAQARRSSMNSGRV